MDNMVSRNACLYNRFRPLLCASPGPPWLSECVKLYLRHKRTYEQTNWQRDKRTDARNRIWCICRQYFHDFPENQLTKFRVAYLLVDSRFLS